MFKIRIGKGTPIKVPVPTIPKITIPKFSVAGRSVLRTILTHTAALIIGCLFTWWYLESIVNARWVNQISESSASVKQAIGQGNGEAEAVDRQALEAIRGLDEKLKQAQAELARTRGRDKCFVPADCLRSIGGDETGRP